MESIEQTRSVPSVKNELTPVQNNSHLFSKREPDPLLRELDGNVLWFWQPMMPMDAPFFASMRPFEAAERIRELEAKIAELETQLANK